MRGCPLLADTIVLLNTVYLNTIHAILNHRIKYSELTTNVFHCTYFSLTYKLLKNNLRTSHTHHSNYGLTGNCQIEIIATRIVLPLITVG